MKNAVIGFGITGSFCTFKKLLPVIKELKENCKCVVPVFSYAVLQTDTRFYKAADFYKDVTEAAGIEPIATITGAEPIGPSSLLDLMVIAPCTGNTLAKLNHGITDTPVLMAAKAHTRNNKPLLIAVSTNDGLSGNAKNIGDLLNRKNVYFVPFSQDNYKEKSNSLVADFALIKAAAEAALEGRQLQPLLLRN